MAELYFNLVINKKRTCDELNTEITKVPTSLIADVTALLEERGYDKNGNKVAWKFKNNYWYIERRI